MNAELASNDRHGRRLILFGFAGLVVIVLIFLVVVFVWPTRYRYDHMNERGNIFPVRTDRITGVTEILYSSGWKRTAEITTKPDQDLPYSEMPKVTGDASLSGRYLFIDVYNASAWLIREVTISFSVTGPAGELVLSRQYRESRSEPVSPLSNGSFSVDLGFYVQPDQKWTWSILGAKGTAN